MIDTVTIFDTTIKDKKNGDKYLSVKTDKGHFNCFDDDISEELLKLRGSCKIEYSVSADGKFKTITSVTATLDSAIATPVQAKPSLDVQRLIVRQSCLKAAVEMVNRVNFTDVNELKSNGTAYARMVELIAEEFESWIFR